MTKLPTLTSSFNYRGNKILVHWFDVLDKSQLPNVPWQQVYIIGDFDGKVPIVHYATGDRDNLPGGKLEPGETIDDAIAREVKEELNYSVISWLPLGYQENHEPDGSTVYQLRVYAKLQPDGTFTHDSGGSVVGHSFIKLDSLNNFIRYGEVGERLIELAKYQKERVEL